MEFVRRHRKHIDQIHTQTLCGKGQPSRRLNGIGVEKHLMLCGYARDLLNRFDRADLVIRIHNAYSGAIVVYKRFDILRFDASAAVGLAKHGIESAAFEPVHRMEYRMVLDRRRNNAVLRFFLSFGAYRKQRLIVAFASS